MKKIITWKEKYIIALQEELTVKDIINLRSVGRNRAIEIRDLAIEYCLQHDIEVTGYRVPCEAVLEVTNRDLEYYYSRMLKEYQANNLNLSIDEG